MKKSVCILLAMGLVLSLAACGSSSGGEASVSSASQTEEAAAQPVYETSYTLGDVTYMIEGSDFFEQQTGSYFETAGGNITFSNGSTLWAGSVLGPDNIMNSNEYAEGSLVAFTCQTTLSGDALRGALEDFAATVKMDAAGGSLASSRQLYESEGEPVFCLIFPTDALQGAEINFLIEGEDVTLVKVA